MKSLITYFPASFRMNTSPRIAPAASKIHSKSSMDDSTAQNEALYTHILFLKNNFECENENLFSGETILLFRSKDSNGVQWGPSNGLNKNCENGAKDGLSSLDVEKFSALKHFYTTDYAPSGLDKALPKALVNEITPVRSTYSTTRKFYYYRLKPADGADWKPRRRNKDKTKSCFPDDTRINKALSFEDGYVFYPSFLLKTFLQSCSGGNNEKLCLPGTPYPLHPSLIDALKTLLQDRIASVSPHQSLNESFIFHGIVWKEVNNERKLLLRLKQQDSDKNEMMYTSTCEMVVSDCDIFDSNRIDLKLKKEIVNNIFPHVSMFMFERIYKNEKEEDNNICLTYQYLAREYIIKKNAPVKLFSVEELLQCLVVAGNDNSYSIDGYPINSVVVEAIKPYLQEILAANNEKKQLNTKLLNINPTFIATVAPVAPARSSTTTTDDASPPTITATAVCHHPLCAWTRSMDIALTRAVKEFLYDFEAISIHMMSLALAQHFVNSDCTDNHLEAAALTNEQCRLRWSELDTNRWRCDVSTTDTTTHNNIIANEVIIKEEEEIVVAASQQLGDNLNKRKMVNENHDETASQPGNIILLLIYYFT